MTPGLSPLTERSILTHDEFGTCSCRWTANRRTLHMQSLRVARLAARFANTTCTSAARDGASHAGDSCQSSAAACDQQGLQVHRRDVLMMSGALAAASRCSPAEVNLSSMLHHQSSIQTLRCCPESQHCCTSSHHCDTSHIYHSNFAWAPSQASALPPAFDQVWESMGGGPSDLTFPASPFLGRWDVTSTLIKVDLPLGPDFVPDMQVRCMLLIVLLVSPTPS